MPGRRRWAAVVALAALAGSGCSSGGLETPRDALEQEGDPASPFGYVLAEPPGGYELCAISTPSALSLRSEATASLHVYGDASLDDPYDGPLYGVALFAAGPLDELALGRTTEGDDGGAPGLLGGADGLLVASLPENAGQVLTYRADEDRIVQLAARGTDSADLVPLASAVEVDGDRATIDLDALPAGYRDLGDVYELEGRPRFRFSVDYQRRAEGGGLDDQLTVLGAAGGLESMQAFRFRAAISEVVDVAGSPGVVADIGGSGEGPHVATWLVEGELIVRVFSFELDADALMALAETVVRVDGAEWDELRSSFDPPTCGT